MHRVPEERSLHKHTLAANSLATHHTGDALADLCSVLYSYITLAGPGFCNHRVSEVGYLS